MCRVSVIVPVYNVEKYLDKCLDSLIKQTLEDIEIIVVNDGTLDNSQKIIDNYVKKFPNKIRSYQKKNGGLSSARNFGLQYARGKYVTFVDSDDWVLPNMYSELYKKAIENEFDIVVCDFNEIIKGKAYHRSCHLHDDILSKDKIKEAMIHYYPAAWNKIYKKNLLDKLHLEFKMNVWFEDVEFAYRLLPYVTSIGVVNKPFYQYLIREGSITASSDIRIYDYIYNWDALLSYYRNNDLYKEYFEILEYCYVRYIYATFIKAAVKFSKYEYEKAVDTAIEHVESNFPNYRNNIHIQKKSIKNAYLKAFNPLFARLVYIYCRKNKK